VTAAVERVAARHASDGVRDLPLWPLWLLFAGFPVLWVLGLGAFITQLAAVPMAAYLLTSGRIRYSRGFGVWILFLVWMMFSVVEISGGSRFVGFGYRASLYGAATVIFLYVYNTSRRRLPVSRAAAMATVLLVFVVIGGILGALAPHHILHTPFGSLLPAHLASNDFVSKLVNPPFAQTLDSRYVHIAPRPSAPFPYTNDWGVNFALLIPFVVAWLSTTRRLRTRVLLIGLTVIGLIPAVLTSNRGMLLALGVGFLYAAVRFALRGHAKALVLILVFGGIAAGLFSALHLDSRLNDRLASSQTNNSRISVYSTTYQEVKRSPVLGFGAPSASIVSVSGPQLGTQGELWTLLYSQGIPGATFFVVALAGFAWSTRKPADAAGMWMHVVPIMALSVLSVYRMEGTELALVMMAAALALRDRPARRSRQQVLARAGQAPQVTRRPALVAAHRVGAGQ
jgi:polysaccharide biosynthesis protein PslJ